MKKNIKINLMIYMLATTLVTTSFTYYNPTVAFAQNESDIVFNAKSTIKIDGITISNNLKTATKDDIILIESEELFSILDLQHSYNEHTEQLTVKNKNNDVLVIPVGAKNEGSKRVTLNDSGYYMPISAQYYEGRTYLPFAFIAETFGYRFDWDTTNENILLKSDRDYFYLDNILHQEKLDTTITMSLQEAHLMAIKNSSNINNLNDIEEYQTEILDDLKDQTRYRTAYNLYYEQIFQNLKDVENSIKSNEMQIELYKTSLEYTIVSMLSNIQVTDINTKVLAESIPVEEENIRVLEAKVKYGMASPDALIDPKNNLANTKINLESLERSLAEQKFNLATLLGTENQDIVIDLDADFSEIDLIDLDIHIKNTLSNSIQVEIIEDSIDTIKTKVDKYTEHAEDIDILQLENNLKSERRNLSDTQDDLTKSVNSLYNELLSLRDKDLQYQLSLQKAKEDYNTAVVNFEVGNIIKSQVMQAEFVILSIEKDMKINQIEYILKLYTFNNPDLL